MDKGFSNSPPSAQLSLSPGTLNRKWIFWVASWKHGGLGGSEEGRTRLRPLGCSGGHGALHGLCPSLFLHLCPLFLSLS